MLGEKRHGKGLLAYTSTNGVWIGRWKNDLQHGFTWWLRNNDHSSYSKTRYSQFFVNDQIVFSIKDPEDLKGLIPIDMVMD